jgi:hypothetical protein
MADARRRGKDSGKRSVLVDRSRKGRCSQGWESGDKYMLATSLGRVELSLLAESVSPIP